MYIRKTWNMDKVIDVEMHYPGNYGAPGVPRGAKRNRTPEQITMQNTRNREKFLQRLILANFDIGDWHLTLNYRYKDRPDFQTGKKQVRNFLGSMRKVYKKAGIPFKYIVVTENGKKGHALHHHLVIQDIRTDAINTVQLVKQLWKYGNTYWSDLYEDGEYKDLAGYIVKKETKNESEWASYSRSRNLIVPKPKRKAMHRKHWPEQPWIKKGYELIKDSLIDGVNPVTGYPYRHYSMRRTRQRE